MAKLDIPSPLVTKYLPKGGKNVASKEGGPGITAYKDTYPKMAFRFALLGVNKENMARLFNVERNTIDEWVWQHDKFAMALVEGSECADANVAESVYQRALGYEVDEERVLVVDGEIVTKTIRKHIPGDMAAAKFWLTNRRKEDWQQSPELVIEAHINTYEPVIKRFDGSLDEEADDNSKIIEGETET